MSSIQDSTGDTDIDNKRMDTVLGEEGEGGMYAESNMETYIQFSSVTQLCLTLCDPMDCRAPGLPVHHNSQSLLKLMPI